MNNGLIYPFLSMTGLTFLIMPLTSLARFRAIFAGRLRVRQFKLMTLGDEDEFVTKTTRHYNNHFEVPVLFYALVLLALILEMNSPVLTYSAWSFVFFRVLHSIVHITYNKVMHRFIVFFLSCISLLVFFITLILKLN